MCVYAGVATAPSPPPSVLRTRVLGLVHPPGTLHSTPLQPITQITRLTPPPAQVKSSVDYAHGNWLTTFLCGALNYQVTHHLFPTVSQVHFESYYLCRSMNWCSAGGHWPNAHIYSHADRSTLRTGGTACRLTPHTICTSHNMIEPDRALA